LIKGGVSYLVEQVVNPTNFESKIADEVSFFLGLERSDLNELNADKLDDISDDEDDLLKDEPMPEVEEPKEEEATEPKVSREESDHESNHDEPASVEPPAKESQESKVSDTESILKDSKSKVSEEEFSLKFKNTFAETNQESVVDKPDAIEEADTKPVDISPPEMVYSNSSISDGSLPCAPSPEPIESSKSELDLLSSKIEDEIANQLEKDIAFVQHIYKDFVNEASVNANAAPLSKSTTSKDDTEPSSKVTFTASQLTFKDKFLFVNETTQNETMEVKEKTSDIIQDVPMDLDSNLEPACSAAPMDTIQEVKCSKTVESTSIEIKENSDEVSAIVKTEKYSSFESIKTNVVKVDSKKAPEKLSNRSKDTKGEFKTDESGLSKGSKGANLSDLHRNQRIAKEKTDKLSKIQDELREKRDFVRYKLKEESYIRKTSKEEVVRKVKSSSDKSSGKLSKSSRSDKQKKGFESSKRTSKKSSKSSESTKKKPLNQESNDFASDVSSVHTSDLSDFDDQISLSSSDDEEHKKKRISMQQLKQMLH
jgi:hypothetical protein